MRTTLSFVLAVATLGMTAPAAAQQTAIPATEPAAVDAPQPVIQNNDPALTCGQIGEEAARLSETMGGAPGGGMLAAAGGAARAGAAMLIPGAGLVMAGADALTQGDRDRREAERAAVQHRWYYLNGLHMGKGCQQAADVAVSTPVVPPTPKP